MHAPRRGMCSARRARHVLQACSSPLPVIRFAIEALQHYLAYLRIVAKPTKAKRAISMIIVHPESMGMAKMDVRVAKPATVLLRLVVCRALTGIVLTKLPALVVITCTVTVQQPGVVALPAGIERGGDKVTVFPPAVAVTGPLPGQVVLALGGAAITTPSGRVSVNGKIRSAGLLLGLHSVMMRVGSLC